MGSECQFTPLVAGRSHLDGRIRQSDQLDRAFFLAARFAALPAPMAARQSALRLPRLRRRQLATSCSFGMNWLHSRCASGSQACCAVAGVAVTPAVSVRARSTPAALIAMMENLLVVRFFMFSPFRLNQSGNAG